MDDLLKADPVYDHFSTNQHLKYYRQPLVETGSVNHIIPFKHSHNYQGKPMENLRPDVRLRMYPSTASEELATKFLKNKRGEMSQSRSGSPATPREDSIIPKMNLKIPITKNKKPKERSPETSIKKGTLGSTMGGTRNNIDIDLGGHTLPGMKTAKGMMTTATIPEETGPIVSRSSIGSLTRRTRRKRGASAAKTETERIDRLVDAYFEE